MAEATLLVKLPEHLTVLVDEIITNRRSKIKPIMIVNTEEEVAEAKVIQEEHGTKAANKFLKEKERDRVKLARKINSVPSRTAVVLEVLEYALPLYKTVNE